VKATYLTYQTYALINAPLIHTDLIWDLTILFAVLSILYFACVFFFRNKISYRNKKSTQRKRELTPMVSEFLFHEPEATKEENTNYVNLKIEIRELLKEPVNRKLFSEILLDLQKDVLGETLNRLHKLYIDLGLDQDAFSKLKSWKWHVVSKGILELTKMEVPKSYGIIKKFINTKKGVIRKQAEIATVTLKHEGINYFLDTTTHKISEWQQLKLLDILRNFEDFQPPRFKVWLTSNNKDVVLFSLRLVKYYNQNDANTSITELIKHKNNQIKTEAIYCIKEFNIVEAVEPLKNIFWKCTENIKLLILGAVASLGKEEDIVFLQLVANKDSSFTVKSKALGAINTICPESVMPTKGIDKKLTDSSWKEVMEYNGESEEYVLVEPKKDKLPIEEDADTITDIPVASKDIVDSHLPIEETTKESLIEDKELVDNVYGIEVFTEERPSEINDKEEETIDFPEISIDSSPEEEEVEEELNFLPIVVGDEIDDKIFLNDGIENETDINPSSINLDDDGIVIDFLPFIVEEQEDNIEVANIEVIYEEIVAVENDKQFKINEIEVIDPNVVTTSKNKSIDITDNGLSAQDILKQQDDLTISPVKENFEFNFIPIVEDITENKECKNDTVELVDTAEVIKTVIPKAMLPEMTFEEKAKQLLDDIEEFGDQREVSLLNGLLEEDAYKFISDRIQNILKKFNDDNAPSIPENENLKPFSVFEDLFRICDTEAKLILMDEIVAVGDEKEIIFLNDLLDDDDASICSKAEKVLKELQNKLMAQNILSTENLKTISQEKVSKEYSTLMNELEIEPAKPTDIFDVEFEFSEDVLLTGESDKIETKTKKIHQASFMSHICSFSNKIINKFNG